jgi:hypothetical protein
VEKELTTEQQENAVPPVKRRVKESIAAIAKDRVSPIQQEHKLPPSGQASSNSSTFFDFNMQKESSMILSPRRQSKQMPMFAGTEDPGSNLISSMQDFVSHTRTTRANDRVKTISAINNVGEVYNGKVQELVCETRKRWDIGTSRIYIYE